MPISDTWAGLSPMDSIASVGSCNSVTSSNSAFSDEHLDYLSAEERECLLFLEETIDSLETEEDSGISTDELDRTETSAKIGSILEKSTIPHPELAHSQNTEPDEKIPWEVSPNSNKNSINSTSLPMVQVKSGKFKIPRAVSPNRSKNSINSTTLPMVKVKSGIFKVPRAVSPNRIKNNTDSTSPQMVRAKSGANTLPKYNVKLGIESKSTLSPSRLSESSRDPIFSGDLRPRSHTVLVQHQLTESKDDKAKLGPPTAPKPRKLPPQIILKSCHKNDGSTISSTNSLISFKISKSGPQNNGHHLSRDGGAEGEVLQIRMEALSKLGLLSEPDGQKRPSLSLKAESASVSQSVTAGDEMKANPPEVPVRDKRTTSLIYPSNRSAASAVDPGMNGIANKPANVNVGNKVNKAPWQLGATKSSSLKMFNTAGENIPPTGSLGSALNTSATTALGPGTSHTLPSARRSANVNEGQVKNIKPPQWQFGATKTSSLKRFGTANDNNPPTLYSGITQNTSVASAAVPGLNKYVGPRPASICSEKDLSVRHGSTLEAGKPGGKSFPIRINHISSKFPKSPPKGLNVQAAPQGPTSSDHTEALRKLGLLKK
uniref:specifically androgen-regulated gene protein n=1 Tax=Pristiophorus japonicus TaxID=55135 RepID=UPI00398EB7C9